jgi:6-phosphogluconolactonase
VAEVVSADNSSLFVVNKDDNTIVQFVIGHDGKLYAHNTVNTPGVYPMAVAMNASYLFVADTYQPLATCSSASPCSGSVAVYPVTAATSSEVISINTAATNTANSSQYWPLTLTSSTSDVIVPTAVTVSGSYLFVSAYDSTVSPNKGYIFAFTVGTGGVLTAVSGSPFAAGIHPSGLSADGTGKYLYASDFTGNSVLGFTISSGVLTTISGSPWTAGNGPSAIVADPSYGYVYVANATDSNVMAYTMSTGSLVCNKVTLAAGALCRLDNTSTGTAGTGTYSTGSYPVAIGIDPSKKHFLYTANFLGSSVSSWQLSTTDGTLLVGQNSPATTNENPTAVAAVPHTRQ